MAAVSRISLRPIRATVHYSAAPAVSGTLAPLPYF